VVSLGIFSVAPPDGTMCPRVDTAPEKPGIYPGVKAAGVYG